ncbi:MarR family transcriptional regulator [Paenibacillus thiaminolyticus]|uniref:MarR family transcriptional regulator n=1 Tax=Paenibacillus thiaminolyticus TaxID=49283 RepID=UPI003D2B9FFF
MEHSDPLKKQIYDLRWKMMHLIEQEESWEIATFRKKALEEGLSEGAYNFTIIHVIDCIGRYEPINTTSIAEKMELSKASITKMTSKLFDEGFVKRTQLNDNKKEVYFRLTPKGRRLFDLHEHLHQVEENRFLQFLDRYTPEQLDCIKQFSRDLVEYYEQKLTEGADG